MVILVRHHHHHHHNHYHHHHHHHHQHAIWPASSFLYAAAWAPASSHPHLSSASDAASGARLGCRAARAARPRPHLVRLTKRCGPSASSAACGWCGSRALADFSCSEPLARVELGSSSPALVGCVARSKTTSRIDGGSISSYACPRSRASPTMYSAGTRGNVV